MSSFLFYDLETSGINPRQARIMQFAGQRTDQELKPIGQPINTLIKLTPDVLPDPGAILITGITPQTTIAKGITEAEFLKQFYAQAVRSGTIFVGFNNVRFDDEFINHLNYRNFYDAYEWRWKDGSSRWDILDLVRMTRALRPEGIEWPYAPDGKPSNRLELLTSVNHLGHDNAHDALSDVHATIAVAKLVRTKQLELFNYLLDIRDKNKAKDLVTQGQPFVYTSGRYPSATYHTTVAIFLAPHPKDPAALVYDLRHDPTTFAAMSPEEMAEAWRYNPDPDAIRLPIKTLKYNRCPAIAPLGVIKDKQSQERIELELSTVEQHLKLLKQCQKELVQKVTAAVELMDQQRASQQADLVDNQLTVDERLHDGFFVGKDKLVIRRVTQASPAELDGFAGQFQDARLNNLLPLYKARNFPSSLSAQERQQWEEFRIHKLLDGGDKSRLASYFNQLQELAKDKLTKNQQYLVEELKLYGKSIMPADAID